MTGLELRTLPVDDFPAIARFLNGAFGEPVNDADIERELVWFEPERSLGAYAGTELAGITWVLSMTLEVPGGPRPTAGVTAVGVSPVHRRRGVLTALMTRQLRDVHEAGVEAVAALWASEGGIYGRFGYGSAAPTARMRVERTRAVFRQPPDKGIRLRLAAPDVEVLRPVYDAARAGRPGWVARNARFWNARLTDQEHQRGGATAYTAVLADGDGAGTEGYAVYRTRPGDDRAGIPGVVQVLELITTTTRARTELWRFLTGVDLMAGTEAFVAVDEPLPHLLVDPRAPHLSVRDSLWIRLVDLPRALTERSYASPVDVTLEVVDDVCPWNAGRWRLEAGPEGGTCVRTDRTPDLTLGAAELGTVFLGGPTLRTLAAAGRVDEVTPGALTAASRAFVGDVAPFCTDVF